MSIEVKQGKWLNMKSLSCFTKEESATIIKLVLARTLPIHSLSMHLMHPEHAHRSPVDVGQSLEAIMSSWLCLFLSLCV